jgi:tRNA threonylcarbamoyladenosine biosynthesis protein TsaB
MNKLFIDTSVNTKISVALEINNIKDTLYLESALVKSEVIIPLIRDLLHKKGKKIEDLSGIIVNQGPGSFTGLRVGISVANALGFILKIPINGKKIGELAKPVYNNIV